MTQFEIGQFIEYGGTHAHIVSIDRDKLTCQAQHTNGVYTFIINASDAKPIFARDVKVEIGGGIEGTVKPGYRYDNKWSLDINQVVYDCNVTHCIHKIMLRPDIRGFVDAVLARQEVEG